MTQHDDAHDYNLRVLIEQMVRTGRSEREIELAVREAAGQRPTRRERGGGGPDSGRCR